MSSSIGDHNIDGQSNVNQIESTNTNHIDTKTNEANQTFRKQIERKPNDKSLIEYEILVSNEEKKPLIEKENTEKDSISTEKNLDEALKNLGNLSPEEKKVQG